MASDRSRSSPESAIAGLGWRTSATLLVLAALCVAWELAVRAGLLTVLFFPPPSMIARAFVRLWDEGILERHLFATVSRLAWGMLLGGVPALALGLAMGWSRSLRLVVDPIVAAAHALPKIALLPLIMIVTGVGENSRVAIAVLGAFFPMLISTMAGARLIHPIHFEVAQNYGARRHQVFWRVVLPGSLPMVLSGTRLALNSTLLLTVAVEMLNAREGLGWVIWRAWETMRTEELYTSLFLIVAIGIGSNLALQGLTARWVPWQVERE